jgi:hypothetical protein
MLSLLPEQSLCSRSLHLPAYKKPYNFSIANKVNKFFIDTTDVSKCLQYQTRRSIRMRKMLTIPHVKERRDAQTSSSQHPFPIGFFPSIPPPPSSPLAAICHFN